jgi:hypothetical protein
MKTQHNIDRYLFRTIWSEEDNEFVGLCDEFPSLSYLAPLEKLALIGIHKIVAGVIEDMTVNNEDIPEPLN